MHALVEALLSGDASTLEALLERMLLTVMSYQDPGAREPEKLYHRYRPAAAAGRGGQSGDSPAGQTLAASASDQPAQGAVKGGKLSSRARSRSARSSPAASRPRVGECVDGLGYRVRIFDGNHLPASDKRLNALRGFRSAALPGQFLVVFDDPVADEPAGRTLRCARGGAPVPSALVH